MIFIRADANEHIGTGHIMRCISIARAFARKGKEIIFITADHKGDALISGFPVICLDSIWNRMDSETDKLTKIIKERKPELFLIDSYFVTEEYVRTLSKIVSTAYMDDMNAKRWDVDYLINYNIFAGNLEYSWYENTRVKLLLNPQYTPLRDEFRDLPEHVMKPVKDVLISAGGADPERVTERILESICPKHSNIVFHFIVGALNPRIDVIKSLAGDNAVLHINEHNMSRLMQKCDIAISAAGTTLYELCATGIPTITFTLADNQLIAAEQFEKHGIMLNAGDCRNNPEFENYLSQMISALIEDHNKRTELSNKMQRLVDGNGAERIVDRIINDLFE